MSALRQGEPVNKEVGYRCWRSKGTPDWSSLSHVWSEPGQLDKAAYEFAETEAQLTAAEDVCGPYVWGVYDLLVLPPSFPFGGMENPCLTFVSPSIIVISGL